MEKLALYTPLFIEHATDTSEELPSIDEAIASVHGIAQALERARKRGMAVDDYILKEALARIPQDEEVTVIEEPAIITTPAVRTEPVPPKRKAGFLSFFAH